MAAVIDAVDVERRQASYVRREREYKTKVELLEAELSKSKASAAPSIAESEAERHMGKLRDLHGTIVSNIDHVQEQTGRILQEQERDLLRAFRARLFDLQTELEKEKSRAEDGAAMWIEKNRQLQKELDWAKEMADRLDRHNQALARDNVRLKNQFKTQEDDREYLIKQLVAAKKDNARLRTEVNRNKEAIGSLQSEVEDLKIKGVVGPAGAAGGGGLCLGATASSVPPSPRAATVAAAGNSSGGGATTGGDADRDGEADAFARGVEAAAAEAVTGGGGGAAAAVALPADIAKYRDALLRLKRVLDAERRACRGLRAQLAAEVGARTEAEMFLRRAIEEARGEVDRKRQAVALAAHHRRASGGATSPRAAAAAAAAAGGGFNARRGSASSAAPEGLEGLVDLYRALTRDDREQVLASLLAQEHVLTALQRISFPQPQEGGGGGSNPGSRRNSFTGEPPAPVAPAPPVSPVPTAARAISAVAPELASPAARGAVGFSAGETLQAAREYTERAHASARERLDAAYGADFDAHVALRGAGRHVGVPQQPQQPQQQRRQPSPSNAAHAGGAPLGRTSSRGAGAADVPPSPGGVGGAGGASFHESFTALLRTSTSSLALQPPAAEPAPSSSLAVQGRPAASTATAATPGRTPAAASFKASTSSKAAAASVLAARP